MYKKVVYETLAFVEEELTAPGGILCFLDADSEGVEGKYYVWTKAEIETALGNDAEIFSAHYHITEAGNWEHGNSILLRHETDESFAKQFNISVETLNNTIDACKKILKPIRDKRIKPGLDDKILSSWNALMIAGYTQAYRVFGEENFLKAAVNNADFLLKKCNSRKRGDDA
ncbi:MAG: thioredoxin domain-containing protein [Chitinophagaceae bacterium]|nr:thioredoxin domain-containing protein [Chitinophagaceae bacterium]